MCIYIYTLYLSWSFSKSSSCSSHWVVSVLFIPMTIQKTDGPRPGKARRLHRARDQQELPRRGVRWVPPKCAEKTAILSDELPSLAVSIWSCHVLCSNINYIMMNISQYMNTCIHMFFIYIYIYISTQNPSHHSPQIKTDRRPAALFAACLIDYICMFIRFKTSMTYIYDIYTYIGYIMDIIIRAIEWLYHGYSYKVLSGTLW